MTTPTARADAQFRKERREAKRAAQERHARDAVECARCGLTRSNVIHETDREHAPEGLAYYSDVPFCPFVSTMPWVRDDRSRGHPMTTPTARDVMLDEPTDSLIRRLVRAAWVTGKNGLWAGPINNGVIAKELIARADAADVAQQEVARLTADLATFTAEPDIRLRLETERVTYWYEQCRLHERKADAAQQEVARLREALEFAYRRFRSFYSDGPAMHHIAHALLCGCGDDQHDWHRPADFLALAPASPVAHAHDFRVFNNQVDPPRRVCQNLPCPGGFNTDPASTTPSAPTMSTSPSPGPSATRRSATPSSSWPCPSSRPAPGAGTSR